MLVIPQRFGGLVIPRSRGVAVPTYAFITSTDSTDNSSSYTYPSQPFGTAAANRYIAVAAMSAGGGGNHNITGITIGGVAASRAVFVANTQTTCTGIYILAVPTGTSGDVVVNYAATQDRAAIGIWALYGISSATPVATNTGVSSGSNDLSLTGLPAGAIVLSAQAGINSPSFSWNSLNTDFSGSWSDTSGGNQRFAGASTLFAAGGNLSITATTAGSSRTSAVSVAFR